MWTFKKGVYSTELTQIVFNPFDHMVVNFTYTKPTDGSDLDLMVYYDTHSTPDYFQDAVGYGQLPNDVKIPTNATADASSYLWWANDDAGSPSGTCIEAVVLGVKNFTDNVVVVGNQIDIALRAGWYGSNTGTGSVTVNLKTYLGGTMSQSGTNIINTGGVLVDNQTKVVHVASGTGQVTLGHSDLLGTVRYDKVLKTASLI